MKLNQKGFGAVEGLLILILLSILGFTGYYVYDTRDNTDKGYRDAASTTQTTETNTAGNKTKKVAGERAKELVTRLWHDASSLSNHNYISAHVSDGWFTDNFKTLVNSGKYDNTGGNPVTCTNGIQPDHFDISEVSLTDGTAIVTLLPDGLKNSAYYPTPTMKYINGNWAIEDFECVENPGYKV